MRNMLKLSNRKYMHGVSAQYLSRNVKLHKMIETCFFQGWDHRCVIKYRWCIPKKFERKTNSHLQHRYQMRIASAQFASLMSSALTIKDKPS